MGDRDLNVIIITLDGLRTDRLHLCPHLNDFFNKSILFSNMVSASPYTFTSMPSIFTGLYPSKNGINSYYSMFKFKKDKCKTLTQYFQEKGYYTFANVLNDCVLPTYGFDEIYTHTMEDDLITLHKKILSEIKDKKKFFLYLHYTSIHDLYVKNVREYGDTMEDYKRYSENINKNINFYNSCVIKCDEYIGKITEHLDKLGLLEKTIIIFHSDHGTNNGEKIGEKFYGAFNYDVTIKTFCGMRIPGLSPKAIDFQSRTIDIMPTLLDILRIEPSKNHEEMQGKSLLPMIEGKESSDRIAFSETGGLYGLWPSRKEHNVFSIRYNGKKIIYNKTPHTWEFYDLKKDPAENNNLINEPLSEILDYKNLLLEKLEEVKEEKFFKKASKEIPNFLSTKASTLKSIKPFLKKSLVEEIFFFTESDWRNKKTKILNEIKEKFGKEKIIIRSSAITEDTSNESMAGYFESVLNVNPNNSEEIIIAIKKIINSYHEKNFHSSFNQILVQKQTQNIIVSGVVFTREANRDAPYYVINYDDKTGLTDTVTSGIESKSIKISHFADFNKLPPKISKLIDSIKEIESLIVKRPLDIEFSMNDKGEVIIFQIRPLIINFKKEIEDSKLKEKIEELKQKLRTLSYKREHLEGEENIFADMPDWNPAEIIGDNPHPLDYSLYDYIITGGAWHEARTSQGYYNVNPAKLVVLFGNKPYIDVRNSFNSFLPSSLTSQLRKRLINFYFEKLRKNPELQDKVEFEVLHTCYDLCFEDKAKELVEKGFSIVEIEELKRSLLILTNNLITNFRKVIQEDFNSISEMQKIRDAIKEEMGFSSKPVNSLLKNSKILLDDCREKGTVQFSRLARLAFIGKILLKSLIHKKIINEDFYNQFMNSIKTVATELTEDFNLMNSGEMSKEDFLKKYGHLRQGTYDITSLRYDLNPDLLGNSEQNFPEQKSTFFLLDKETEEKITRALKQQGLNFDARYLLDFTKQSLEARELAKFEFTKNLSAAIEFIALAGEIMGFSRRELAMLHLKDIFNNTSKTREEITSFWKRIITLRLKERQENEVLELPPIIFSEEDLEIVSSYFPKPNYITQKNIQASLVRLKDKDLEIKGKIVMIESGDPGYDWIFTKNIAGLITKYGGVASHMSIRCAEFGIPAAIGCGSLFDRLSNVNEITLDCKLKKIIPFGVT